ncbi:hypothetical protein CRM22_005314 [Opisthorchis felineus]|uniref:Tyrosine--tRNA ligase n=2 Tax=Opisthorchis felineus TaxID=147828 RepID=A0A4V3SF00_OPIFE|nr:hypothetical protein CRM22_005314 [Opisthorchis felineus]
MPYVVLPPRWFFKCLSLSSKAKRLVHTQRTLKTLLHEGYFAELLPSKSEKYLPDLPPNYSVYLGIDPSADSLQLGNLVALMGLLRCHMVGASVLTVVGTGTVAVGDPSGRLTKRDSNLNSNYETNAVEIEHELANIRQNYLENFFTRKTETGAPHPIIILRNGDWLSGMHCLEFLRDIASRFRIPELLEKESVQLRLNSGSGMDLNEFLYPALQAVDFLHLYQNYNCRIQVGGQDQLGNIQCGLDLIHRKLGSYAFGLTVPLLTTPDGKKFGKSETGTGTRNAPIWLSKDKLTPYAFYQRILNLPDQLISSRLLRQLTFFSSDEIQSLMKTHENTPDTRPVQRALARELTLLVHGASALHASELATRIFFPRNKSTEQTSLGIISEELTQQECDCLRAYLAPTVKLVPVIHSQLPVDWSTESVSRWLGCLLQTATSAETESSYVTNCLRKGVTMNDVVLFKPNNRMKSVQHPSDDHLTVDLTVCQLLQEAVGRCEARLGLNILKLGKHEHWFVATKRLWDT